MAQVIRPQKKDDTGEMFQLGGAGIGAVLGGPAGAMTGAGVGGTAAGILAPQQPPAQSLGGGGGSEAAAMARKQQQMSEDNLSTLKNAEASLPGLPESLRQQYTPAIVQARMLEEQRRQQGVA